MVLVISILNAQERGEKEQRQPAVMAGSECVEYIWLLRHVKVYASPIRE